MREQIRRDRQGIPHLTAANPIALARLQGRVTAGDRGWQLSLDRLRGEGRSAAWLGDDAAGWDRFARHVGLAGTARRCFAALDDEHRAWVEAYAAGVTEGLETAVSHEFERLGVRPDGWESWHPILALLVQHVFGSGFPAKLWRAHIVERLGAEALEWFGAPVAPSGSNAWAVNGHRSATGAPLLAADPHRLLEWPGIYQQIGLRCPEFDAVGLAIPGVPGIPHFGQTEHVAWVITSAVADDRDLVVDPDAGGEQPGTGGVLHQRWRLQTPVQILGRCGLESALALLRARTATDAAAAWDAWVEPVNRVLVADRERVMERYAGRVPDRDVARSRLPVAAADWTGWITWSSTEVSDVTVHANQPAESPLTADPVSDDRAVRIRDLLDEAVLVTVEDCARIQTDVRLAEADALIALLDPESGSPVARHQIQSWQTWDRRMDADSVQAGTYARWRHALVDELLATPALAELSDPVVEPLFAPWCSARAWVGLSLRRLLACSAVVGAPGELAQRALERTVNEDATVWGETHRLHPWHALDDDPVLGPARQHLVIPVPGDTDCVLSTGSAVGVSDVCVRVPVARVVFDLADRRRSRWIVPLGSAGDPRSPHAFDQFPAWRAGVLHPCSPCPEPRPTHEGVPVTDRRVVCTADTGIGRLTLRTLRFPDDARTIHAWTRGDYARFWGMQDHDEQTVEEIYAFLSTSPDHSAHLWWLGDEPCCLVQTYAPAAEAIGERYDRRVGDLGLHFFVAPLSKRPRGLVDVLFDQTLSWMFDDPDVARIVAEPDQANHYATARLVRSGFELGALVELPQKTAQLAFLSRAAFELREAAGSGPWLTAAPDSAQEPGALRKDSNVHPVADAELRLDRREMDLDGGLGDE